MGVYRKHRGCYSAQGIRGILKVLRKAILSNDFYLDTCMYHSSPTSQNHFYPFRGNPPAPGVKCTGPHTDWHPPRSWNTTLNSVCIYLFWTSLLMALNSRSETFFNRNSPVLCVICCLCEILWLLSPVDHKSIISCQPQSSAGLNPKVSVKAHFYCRRHLSVCGSAFGTLGCLQNRWCSMFLGNDSTYVREDWPSSPWGQEIKIPGLKLCCNWEYEWKVGLHGVGEV